MDEQEQEKQESEEKPLESQPLEAAQPASTDQLPPETQPAPEATPPAPKPESKITRLVKFAAGFLGWFLVTLLIYGAMSGEETMMICGGLLFPANLVLLGLLLKFQRFAGWGMLAALGVNLIISLIRGLTTNAFCFIPFFTNP